MGTAGLSLMIGGSAEFHRSHFDEALRIYLDEDHEHLSFEELAQLHMRVGAVRNDLDLLNWKVNLTPEFIGAWIEEAAAQIQAQGISDFIRIPPDITFFTPTTALQTNHLLGNTNCRDRIRYNKRFLNEAAGRWYHSPMFLGTIVHELIHFQAQGEQVCVKESTELLEATAQICMLQVLSGMASRGNKLAFKAFVFEQYSVADAALLALALKQNQVSTYEWVRRQTEKTAFEEAREQKMWKEWEKDMRSFKDLLLRYSLSPVEMMAKAHLQNKDKIAGMALQKTVEYQPFFPWLLSQDRGERVVDLSDWAWVLGHLESLAREA